MILPCPICRQERHAPVTEWLRGSAYHRCASCGVEFIEPRPGTAPVFPDYSAHAARVLEQANDRWTMLNAEQPSEYYARQWARTHLPAGAVTLELYAETGRLAWWLRRAGFQVQAADPVATHAAVLRDYGFTVAQGQLDDIPVEWPAPAAIFVLESIVRVLDPRGLIEGVRDRWPTAAVFITAPSALRSLKLPGSESRGYLPPDFVTRWDSNALQRLLATCGYRAHARPITPGLVSRLPLSRPKRRLINLARAMLLRANGEYVFSECAWGLPAPPAP